MEYQLAHDVLDATSRCDDATFDSISIKLADLWAFKPMTACSPDKRLSSQSLGTRSSLWQVPVRHGLTVHTSPLSSLSREGEQIRRWERQTLQQGQNRMGQVARLSFLLAADTGDGGGVPTSLPSRARMELLEAGSDVLTFGSKAE